MQGINKFIIITIVICLYSSNECMEKGFWPDNEHSNVLNLLIDAPEMALTQVDETKKQLQQKVDDIKKVLKQACPIYLLTECFSHGIDAPPCALSRLVNPHIRTALETRVCKRLLKEIKTGTNIHYAGYACNGAFQDLVIIAKTLNRKPESAITVNLIDSQHVLYVAYRGLIKNGREVTGDGKTVVDASMMASLKDTLKQEYGLENILYDDHYMMLTITETETKYKQFIKSLVSWFPAAYIRLFLHTSGEDYTRYLARNGESYPDVITVTHIDDKEYCQNDYVRLCLKTLYKKPDSHNFWLSAFCKDRLLSISLKAFPGAIAKKLSDRELGEVTFYQVAH